MEVLRFLCLVIGSIFFLQKKSSCWEEEEEDGGGGGFIFTHNVSKKVISRAMAMAINSNLLHQSSFISFRMYVEEIIHVDKTNHIPVQYLFKKKSFHSPALALAPCSLAVIALTTVANHQFPPLLYFGARA
jgi:hypothetical protein